MLRPLFSHRKWLILMLSAVAVIIFLSPGLQHQPLKLIGDPVTSLMVRIQSGISSLTRGLGTVWDSYIALVDTYEENQRLSDELESLRGENIRLQELALENERLLLLLEFKQETPLKLTAARVVGRDPTNWYKTIMIDKGEADGLRPNMGVITPAGVVGKIIRTTSISSQVLLLTDHHSSVAALIQRTRDEGLVEGMEAGHARMKYLPNLSELQAGDMVVTSGLAGIFPKGLLIGRVSEFRKKEDDLFQVVPIIPAVDFTKLEEVLVILDL